MSTRNTRNTMETMETMEILKTVGTQDKVTGGRMMGTPCRLMRFPPGRRKRMERKGPVITVIIDIFLI